MSFLDQISVGVLGKRDHHNLSGHTHTTTELGYFQPTFCRYIVPDSNMKISARSICRLSPVAVPTIGQVSVRNYFTFVDIGTLWTPFDAMREGTNYRYGDGTITTPKSVPTFRLVDFFKSVFSRNTSASNGVIQFRESVVFTVYKSGTPVSSASTALSDVLANHPTDLPFTPYIVRQVTNCQEKSSESASSVGYNTSRSDLNDFLPVVKNTNADFACTCRGASDTYHILGKFTGFSKRVRKHFLGCGYSFNPFDDSRQTLLKLFAVYKSWFDIMAIQRTINFNNTYCYNLIKYLSETPPLTYVTDSTTGKFYCDLYNTTFYAATTDEYVNDFITSLGDLCYNLPPDYFSASDTTAVRGASERMNVESLEVLNPINGNKIARGITTGINSPTFSSQNDLNTYGYASARGNQISDVLMKFVNKRSVVGRKIADLLALNGEKDIHNNEHETVHHLGKDRIDIDINPIFSQSSTSDANLGDYAAVGYGQGETDRYVYDTKTYGILLCLSAVVPVSGYFQGILHENGDSNMFDFFKQDFDALGYQAIAMNELVADYQFQSNSGTSDFGTDLGFFGVTPRYQHLKLGRNICNGDMSIPSLQPVMLPYTLDRHFITCKPVGNADDFAEVKVPVNDPTTFRQIRANDAYGDYNRIFQYVGSDYDHFILHFNFNVDVVSPMKSVANSYDTFQDDDTKALEFAHE